MAIGCGKGIRLLAATLVIALNESAIYASSPAVTCIAQPQALLEDINIINVENGSVEEHRDVLVAAGKIALIARTGQTAATGVPKRIYAGGKYLLPGFWVGRVRPASREQLKLYVGYGVTGLIEPDGKRASGQANGISPHIVPGTAETGLQAKTQRTNSSESADAVHAELEQLVASGLSAAAALRAVTIDIVRKLHLDAQFGAVATGKEADLVILDANPLQDIRNTRAIDAVILGGRYFDRRQLDNLLLEGLSAARN